jgi:replicative DNA helicase
MVPTNEEAELSLLAGLVSGMALPSDAADVYAKISSAAFHSVKFRAVYEACRLLYSEDPELVDAREVIDRLMSTGMLDAAGGAAAVAGVFTYAATGANVRYWAVVVEEFHKRRQLAMAASEAVGLANDITTPIASTLDGLGERISSISSSRKDLEVQTLSQLVGDEFKAIEQAYQAEEEETGVRTGFHELDEMVGGLMPAELTILAGRPAMGKTALALAFAKNAADLGTPTLFFSLEMSKRQLIHRLISMHSGISNQVLRRPKMLSRGGMWPKLASAMASLHVDKLAIVDSPSLTVMDVRAAARLCKSKHGLGLIIIDYLQLIRPVAKGHSREREVADISCNLKSISKEMQVPVVCLAQLNRATESQTNNVPRLSNLRESGSLEQDADIVMFVHRPAYYEAGKPEDLAEIYVAKHRHGPTGQVDVGWDDSRTLFYNRGGSYAR